MVKCSLLRVRAWSALAAGVVCASAYGQSTRQNVPAAPQQTAPAARTTPAVPAPPAQVPAQAPVQPPAQLPPLQNAPPPQAPLTAPLINPGGAAPPPRPTGASPVAESVNNASLLLRWVDARGKLYKGANVSRMQWVWSKMTENDAQESPALRLWVSSQLPADWTPTKMSADGITVIEPYTKGQTSRMVIDLRTGKGTLRFEFLDRNQRAIEMLLSIQVTVGRPYVLIKPECGKQDLRFLVHKTEARHLFVGLNCIDLKDSFDIYFFRSKDSGWNNAEGLIRFDPGNRFVSFKYHVKKPKEQTVYSQRLFRVGTVDEWGGLTEYSVFYHPKVAPKRIYASAGMGVTYYVYNEKLLGQTLTQISFTGKVSAGYRLIPKLLDIAFNMFGNVLSVSHSPSTFADGEPLPYARFYGINGRLGYRLPIDMGATEFMFLTGLYYWSMNVTPTDTGQTYGVKTLSGPQLFITMVNSSAGRAGFWMYTKFAMISDQFSITTLGNRELAVGGGFELSPRENKPWAVTLDIAHAAFSKVEKGVEINNMSLLSITGGVQKSF